nr:pentatricopeptide repeat-containing protein [Quercus suber]
MGAAKILFDEMTEKDELTWTTMITGYEKKGDLDADRAILDGMTENMGVARNAMISGYVHHVFILEFIHMSVISACTNAGLFKHGKQVHVFILKEENPKPEFLLSVNNALVMLYWKCALGQHGRLQAIVLFEQTLKENIVPDLKTFLTILSASSHAGLVKEGHCYFNSTHICYGIVLGEDHYARLIDLLVEAGKFSKAIDVIESMPFESGAPIWKALLAGCWMYGNMDLGI